jgi:hypothetical protein
MNKIATTLNKKFCLVDVYSIYFRRLHETLASHWYLHTSGKCTIPPKSVASGLHAIAKMQREAKMCTKLAKTRHIIRQVQLIERSDLVCHPSGNSNILSLHNTKHNLISFHYYCD